MEIGNELSQIESILKDNPEGAKILAAIKTKAEQNKIEKEAMLSAQNQFTEEKKTLTSNLSKYKSTLDELGIDDNTDIKSIKSKLKPADLPPQKTESKQTSNIGNDDIADLKKKVEAFEQMAKDETAKRAALEEKLNAKEQKELQLKIRENIKPFFYDENGNPEYKGIDLILDKHINDFYFDNEKNEIMAKNPKNQYLPFTIEQYVNEIKANPTIKDMKVSKDLQGANSIPTGAPFTQSTTINPEQRLKQLKNIQRQKLWKL